MTEDNRTTPDSVLEEYQFLREYVSLAETTRRLLGHTFQGLVKGCTFREKDCLDEE